MKNWKRECEDLRRRLDIKESRCYELEHELIIANRKFEKLVNKIDKTPKGCTLGSYCRACEFGRAIHVYNKYTDMTVGYYCGKGDTCENFIQKEN